MKYIMFTVKKGTLEARLPVIFPNFWVHRLVAGQLMPMLRQEYDTVSITSAGDYSPITSQCSGESETLKVKSKEEDGDIILKHDYLHGL